MASFCAKLAPITNKWKDTAPLRENPMSIKLAIQTLAGCALLALVVSLPAPALAQYAAKEWPEGAMKQRFTDTCGGCHDINRVRVGYTPQGWLTVVRMMQ